MTPWFSLILPCYNVERYVERCVQSILSQTFTEYEIILVNDGSTDRTPGICDALAEKNPCIRVLHKKNGGSSNARNTGLAVARGRYVWFIDSDDWIESDALRCLHQACVESCPDVLKINYSRIEEDVVRVVNCAVSTGLHLGTELDLLRQMMHCEPGQYGLSGCMHIYRRDMLEAYGIRFESEREIGSEDVLFTMQALFHSRSLYMLQQPFYNYERRNGSLSQTYIPGLAERYVTYRAHLLSYYRENGGSDKCERLVNRFFLWHLIVGTCVTQEYNAVPQWRTMQDARRRVRKLLNLKTVQYAVKHADQTGLTWRKKLQLLAIYLRLEPLFYWLYVVKPRRNTELKRKKRQ